MGKPLGPNKINKPDAERRKKQANRIVSILRVHYLTRGNKPTTAEVAEIAKTLKISDRTVWRYLGTLELLYDALGTTLLDQ